MSVLADRLSDRFSGAWRLLRQATGEAKWDEYVARCERDGVEPMSRRAFERHRADEKEHNPQARCC
ncbi:YbdD/YjiX family protein [Nocardioides sp. NPDC101246]|uniref:YbdD/YjiX family protein n=1 Tax=Nocardioides sp. NPDC101246 TaxID=3364336 RepID=UPI0038206D3C